MVQKTNTFTRRISILILLLLLTACSKDIEIFKGTVHTVDVEDKRVLVISQLKEQDLNKDFKEVLESSEYSQAIWVSGIVPFKYKRGDEVEVSYEASDDSFPAQVTAIQITNISEAVRALRGKMPAV